MLNVCAEYFWINLNVYLSFNLKGGTIHITILDLVASNLCSVVCNISIEDDKNIEDFSIVRA